MDIARLVHTCQRCNGEGAAYVYNAAGQQVYENPCTLCGGDGIANSNNYIDITDIMDKLDDVMDKLNDIKDSVDGVDSRTETILNVANDILEQVSG